MPDAESFIIIVPYDLNATFAYDEIVRSTSYIDEYFEK
jgi:hypothetical protein